MMQKAQVNVLGMIPYDEGLTAFSVEYLSQYLLARVVAGEKWLDRRVSNIFVGAATVDSVYSDAQFHKENKMVITSGDRSDMLLASFEDKSTVAAVLTNNIIPPQSILAKAEERKIPVLLVPYGVYETARQIESLTPLITKNDTRQIEIMQKMITQYVNIKSLID